LRSSNGCRKTKRMTKMKVEQRDGAKRVVGFPFWPQHDFVVVADFGQPDRTEGGMILGDNAQEFWRYRFGMWRYGEVLAIGPGRLTRKKKVLVQTPDVEIGDVIMFSRKHGTRIPGDMRFAHPNFKGAKDGLLLRVLDTDKCVAVMEDFNPWWAVEECQLNPAGMMSG